MTFRYTEQQLAWLQIWYRHWGIPLLTERFIQKFGEQKTQSQIRAVVNNHGFLCGRPTGNAVGVYRLFTKKQAADIRRLVRKHTHAEVTDILNNKYSSGFTIRQIKCFTRNHKINSGRTGYFPKGNVPWNAGTKGLMKPNSGNFKKGHIPANKRPIGSERIDSKDGYVLVKVRERNPYTGTPTRFKLKHVVLWERQNGPVPKGKIIIFRDGNIYNFRPENLVCISKSEHVRLNQMHYKDHPLELKPSIFALAKLKDKVGKISSKRSRYGKEK